MTELTNPHDHFFKESFSRPEVARSFLENYLPQPVLNVLDLSTLVLQKDSFIDPDLSEHFSDLLYQAATRDGEPVFLYLLLEHKSYSDRWTILQLLGYLLRFMEQAVEQGAKQLPIVIPLVVYHGKGQWQAVTNFANLFSGPEELRPYWPTFRYELFDVARYRDEEIRGEVLTQVALLAMKYVFDRNLVARLPEILALFTELANKETALEYLETLLRYLSAAAEHMTRHELIQTVNTTLRSQGDKIMPTIAQEWIEEGLQQGLQQGLEQGIEQGLEQGLQKATRENILDLLNIRFGVAPPDVAEQLAEIIDLAVLRTLHREAATAETPSAFEHFLATIP